MLDIQGLDISMDGYRCRYNLQVSRGDSVALMGPSGGGKSTLLNLIAGFLRPDSGSLNWQGQNLLPLLPHQRPVTLLFQDHNLFSHLSVFQNVALGIHPGARLDSAQRQQVNTMLDEVGLAGFAQRLPTRLSGGQQQRVALARCLVREKPLLLLDEPFSALDSDTRQTMFDLLALQKQKRDLTVITVTHHPEDAEKLGARIETVVDGRLNVG